MKSTLGRFKILALGLAIVALAFIAAACGDDDNGTAGQTAVGSVSAQQLEALAARASIGSSQGSGIQVNGLGRVSATPDLAVLSLGVEAMDDTVARARGTAAQAMGDVINNLRAQGVDDEDIQTTLFNIQPEYTFVEVTEEPSSGERVRRTERRLVGFRVTNTLSVKVRDLDSIGPIIDGAVAAGGDVTRINNIQFTVEKAEELQNQARTLAIRDALAKAEQLAGDTGATLGPLLFISESGGPSTPVIARTEAPAFAADAATPISLGELDVTVIIQAIWAIE